MHRLVSRPALKNAYLIFIPHIRHNPQTRAIAFTSSTSKDTNTHLAGHPLEQQPEESWRAWLLLVLQLRVFLGPAQLLLLLLLVVVPEQRACVFVCL